MTVARTLFAAVVSLVTCGAGSRMIAAEPAPLTLRVVTFNLLHGGILSELTGNDDGSRSGSGSPWRGFARWRPTWSGSRRRRSAADAGT